MKRLYCITIVIFIIIFSLLICFSIHIITQYKSEKNRCQFYSDTILEIYSNIFSYTINNEQWLMDLKKDSIQSYNENNSSDGQLIVYTNDYIMNEMTNYMTYFPNSSCYMTYYYDNNIDTTVFNINIDDDDGMRYTFSIEVSKEKISFSGFNATGMYGIRGD